MLVWLLLVQAAAQAPDIELQATVRARSLTIEKRGNAELSIRTEPEGKNVVDVRAPSANGRKTIRNVQVDVRAEARIADPDEASIRVETSTPR